MSRNYPILYSFRRCPYAMRARLALACTGIRYELREILLRDKPPEMLALSQKGTVPVLLVPDGRVIDESYDIIKWAIDQNDPDGWKKHIARADSLVAENDGPFKAALDRYKYASRFPEYPPEVYRDRAVFFLEKLDRMLDISPFLFGPHQTIADIAIFPFIRQFAHVDMAGFRQLPFARLSRWLDHYQDSALFRKIMTKYPPWHSGNEPIYFS